MFVSDKHKIRFAADRGSLVGRESNAAVFDGVIAIVKKIRWQQIIKMCI